MNNSSDLRSPCPIAATLDLVGDKWTLLIVRDILLFNKHRYTDLAQSHEGIATNILADRLSKLVEAGMVAREPYQQNPIRYEYHLTNKGLDLAPVLKAMGLWAQAHVDGVAQGAPPPRL
ncbi:MAG: winged helix-turn-helix transcriptional regulator [Magnetospiraceae bacterium]